MHRAFGIALRLALPILQLFCPLGLHAHAHVQHQGATVFRVTTRGSNDACSASHGATTEPQELPLRGLSRGAAECATRLVVSDATLDSWAARPLSPGGCALLAAAVSAAREATSALSKTLLSFEQVGLRVGRAMAHAGVAAQHCLTAQLQA